MRPFLILLLLSTAAFAQDAPPSSKDAMGYPTQIRFKKDIAAFEAADKLSFPPADALLCIGSSSMRYWHPDLAEDLSPLTVIPRGFGGSNMKDVIHYADRIILPYKPRAILLYEGDNDIGSGVTPENVAQKFREFVDLVHRSLPETHIYFLAIKPSPKRWHLWELVQKANQLIADECARNEKLTYIDVATPMLGDDGLPTPSLFRDDRLHMNRNGYLIWRDTVRQILCNKKE